MERTVVDNRYVLSGLLGDGGMGKVFLARDEVLERDVALKILREQYAEDEGFVERFEREAKAAASLNYPHIVSVYDRGETEEGTYYIAMEYVPGGTLKDRILKEGTVEAAEAVRLASQIADALGVAHGRDIVHRDVKPQNVLLTADGDAKVADFGIARAASVTTLSNSSLVLGTAKYMSPEQAMGDPVGPGSDLYSLGVVLYEMLTGEVPHDAETPVGTVTKHVSGPLRPPKEVNPEVPEELNAVVVRLLARDPEDRYQDAAGLIEDLERMRPEEPLALAVAHQQASNSANTGLYGLYDPHAVPPPGEIGDAGSKNGRYDLKELIGSGGMAEVYLARDKELDRDVAFKRLRQQYAQDEEVVERFEREAKNAASLSHPNIAAVYDRGKTDDGYYYMVMEYVPGGTLKERISKEGPLPPDEAAAIALQVARALRVAHERGVIHRDVKPQNVLLAGAGRAKVADFGIARAAAASTLTKTGSIMGTAHYLSPEQAIDELVSPRSDLYSLGVVLYEMLTGEVPHDAETPVGILFKHVNGKLRPPKEVNPEIPEGLNAVVVRLLAQEPEDRYQDAAELIEDLERVRRGKPAALAAARRQQDPSPVPTPRGARKKGGDERTGRHWILVPLILLLLALIGGVAYALGSGTTAEAAVPDLVGANSIEEAREMAGDQFEVIEGNQVESREAVGTIVAQTPEAGEIDEPGEISVDVVGTQIADVPDVEGETREEAERILEEAGFEVEITSEESAADYEGYVTEQAPRSDGTETAAVGSAVEIKVGEGPGDAGATERAVPSLGNQTKASNNHAPADQAGGQQPVANSGPKGLPAPAVAGQNAKEVHQPPTSPSETPSLPVVAGRDDRFDDDGFDDDRFDDDDRLDGDRSDDEDRTDDRSDDRRSDD